MIERESKARGIEFHLIFKLGLHRKEYKANIKRIRIQSKLGWAVHSIEYCGICIVYKQGGGVGRSGLGYRDGILQQTVQGATVDASAASAA